jgi:hypothetical protein
MKKVLYDNLKATSAPPRAGTTGAIQHIRDDHHPFFGNPVLNQEAVCGMTEVLRIAQLLFMR